MAEQDPYAAIAAEENHAGVFNRPQTQSYDTKLTPDQEKQFGYWKEHFAPNDSGIDYDYRGAFIAGLHPDASGHWPDTFKKPNHPTFSTESKYAVGPDRAKAGTWAGPGKNIFVPAKPDAHDPYAEIAQQERLNTGVNFAADQNPDQHAQALKAASLTGVPASIAYDQAPETAKQLQMRNLNTQLQQAPPKLRGYFADHPDSLAVAKDDVPVLTKMWNYAREIVAVAPEASAGIDSSIQNVTAAILERLPEPVIKVLTMGMSKDELSKVIEPAAANAYDRSRVLNERQGIDPYTNIALGGAEVTLQNAPFALTGMVVGAPVAVGAVGAGFLAGGQGRGEAIAQGTPEPKASLVGAVDAAIQGGFSMIPLHAVAEAMSSPTASPLKTMITNTVFGQVGMQGATFTQDLTDHLLLHPNDTLADFWATRPDSVKNTLIAGLTGEIIQGGILGQMNRIEKNRIEAETTKQHQQILTKLDGIMSESATRSRSPETIQHITDQALPNQEMRIDANKLVETLKAHDVSLDEVRSKVPAIDEQIDSALQAGGDVVVPASEWMSGMAGEKYNQSLIPETRVGEMELSAKDRQEFGDKQAIEDAKVAQEEAAAINDTKQQVRNLEKQFATQLIKARPDLYSPEAATTTAILAASGYEALAKKLNITPQEAFNRFPTEIGNINAAGDLNQSVFHGSPHVFDQFSLQQIGTGEGNQTFGYGLYFASNKAVAEYYKAVLTTKKNMEGIGATGRLYEVAIPEDNKFIEYDKNINEQSPEVQKALIAAVNEAPINEGAKRLILNGTAPASYAYRKLAESLNSPTPLGEFAGSKIEGVPHGGDKLASEALAAKGIAGIKYLDQVSRQSGKGSSNYVVFDDKLAKIIKYNQDARASILFKDNGAFINLQNADLTSAGHEFAHRFLQMYFDISNTADAPAEIKGDTQLILNWLGVKDMAEYNALSAEQKRVHHETFADGWEHYLFTGKAPNEGLRGVFRTFSEWFKNVYKSMTVMGTKFSPEITRVADRMLSASDQVDVLETQLRSEPMFAKQDKASMSDADWSEYQSFDVERTQKAEDTLQRRSLRDMQWLTRTRSKELARLQKKTNEMYAREKENATIEVNNRPERQMERFLKTGEIHESDGNIRKFDIHKIDAKELADMYDQLGEVGLAPDLSKLKGMVGPNGMHPDDLAKMAGFTSGDELIRKLTSMEPIENDINALTELSMMENHADINTPDALARATDIAVHNDARVRMAATELKFLGAAVNLTKLTQVAKVFAEDTINNKKVGDLRVKDFELAESRSSRKALDALGKGDNVQAVMHKKNQILNGVAAKYAAQALDGIRDQIRYNSKFRRAAVRDSIGGDTVDQIKGILERYGFKEATSTKRPPLKDWIAEQETAGFNPEVPEWMKAEMPTPYSALTVSEFNQVSDAIKSIEETGRNRQKLLTSTQYATLKEAIAKTVESVHANGGKVIEQKVTPAKAKERSKWFGSANLFDQTLRIIDGEKDNGVMYNLLVKTKNAAADYEAARLTESFKKLDEMQKELGGKMFTKTFVPELKMSMTRWERIMFAAYTGTKESYQRLQDGGVFTGPKKLSPTDIRAVLDTLTKPEMDYVQKLWDFNASFWPDIVAKEKSLNGYAPRPAEVVPVETKHGIYPGGYMEIRYDPRGYSASDVNPDTADAAYDANRLGKTVRRTTYNGSLNERVASVKDRPLSLDPTTIYRHVQMVTHDLAFHKWSLDSYRLLHSKEVANAIREHYGDEIVKQLQTDARDFVTGPVPADAAALHGLKWLMRGSGVATMAFNLHTPIMQLLEPFQALTRITPGEMSVGLTRSLAHIDTRNAELSPFMKQNSESFLSGLEKVRASMNDTGPIRKGLDKATSVVVNDLGFGLIRAMHAVSARTVWYGAQYRALEGKGSGFNGVKQSPEAAARFADDTVRSTLGSSLYTDKAAIERTVGGQALTMYWTFFSRTYNLSRGVLSQVHGAKDIPMAAYKFGAFMGLSAFASQLVYATLNAKNPKKALEPQEFGKEAVGYALNAIPYGRELAGAVKGIDYNGPAAFRFFEQAAGLIKDTESLLDPNNKRSARETNKLQNEWWRSMIDTVGVATHTPTSLVDKNLRGLLNYMDKAENPEQIFFGPKVGEK